MSALISDVQVADLSRGAGAVCADFLHSLGAKRAGDVPDADIVVCGADAAELFAASGGTQIVAAITPFGLSGPYAGFKGGELVASAMGGTLRACGYPDRAPVKEAGDACLFHANAMAAAGALFALAERDASGLGQIVDVSVQEVAASRTTNAILTWQFDRKHLARAGPAIAYGKAIIRCIWPLADGFVFHSLMTGRFGAAANRALSDWMDERGATNPMRGVDWTSYDRSALPAETRAIWEAAIETFFRPLTKADVAGEGRRRGINATVVNEPQDLLDDAHLAAREFFVTVPDRAPPGAHSSALRAPGRFVRVAEPNNSDHAPSGAPSAAAGDVRARRRAVQERAAHDNGGPLAGVRVLDFSWALVGSFTTKALGDFGAQVIKVESATRPCLSRIDVQVSASTRGAFDDKPWFAHMNTSKLGMRLNLKAPQARDVLMRLVDWADVIVENFSPGTMQSLGLDYETLSETRPDLVMVSGSVYGQMGPLAREWGVDGTGAALSGRLALTGWPDRAPISPSAVPYGDVVMPPLMAAAAAAALHARRRTGLGRHIDASMYEVCARQMADALIAAQLGEAPRRNGNRDARIVHQGVYPARGEDRWIAISFDDIEAWRRFAAFAGGAWPEDLRDLTEEEREALDARIGSWTSERNAHELMHALQAAGIAAGAVQDGRDIAEGDPQLRARGFLQSLPNVLLGAFPHQATPISFSRSARPMFAAPRLGEHTEMICREILGFDASEVDALRAAEAFV